MRAVKARWKWFAAAVVALTLLCFLVPAVQTIAWVGFKDLEVEFVIADAGTGQPIPGATMRVHNPWPGGLCGGEYREAEFSRVADEGGRVNLLCRRCLCSGEQNRYRDTFSIHLPQWYFVVSAAGYEASELTEMDVIENRRRVERGGERARVVVEIKLQRSGA